jgi:hypothetical protein
LIDVFMQGLAVFGPLVAFFAVYLPSLRRVRVLLRACQQSLLLIPEDVVLGVSSVRDIMKEYAQTKMK